MKSQASAEAMDVSQSLANLRQRPSHAKVRSTAQRRGSTSKPFAVSDRLTIYSVQSPILSRAPRNLGPAYPPSAKIWRSQGNLRRMVLRTMGAPSRS